MNCYGIKPVQLYTNADIIIAKAAVELSCSKIRVVIGKDTDLLILLIHHYTKVSNHYISRLQVKGILVGRCTTMHT